MLDVSEKRKKGKFQGLTVASWAVFPDKLWDPWGLYLFCSLGNIQYPAPCPACGGAVHICGRGELENDHVSHQEGEAQVRLQLIKVKSHISQLPHLFFNIVCKFLSNVLSVFIQLGTITNCCLLTQFLIKLPVAQSVPFCSVSEEPNYNTVKPPCWLC